MKPAKTLVERLADLARETYIFERQAFEKRRTGLTSHYQPSAQWDGPTAGKPDKFGRNCKRVWPSLAEFALRNGVQVDEMIRARFATWTGRQAPNPPDCKTDQAILAVELRSAHLGASVQAALNTERTVAKTEMFFRSGYVEKYGWKAEDVVESLVVDLTIGLSPLFRVILAEENGRPDLAEAFLEGAASQYQRARRYYDASEWGRLIPKSVRAVADEYSAYAAPRGA